MAAQKQSRRDNSVTTVDGQAREILPYQRMITAMAHNATEATGNDAFTGDQLSAIWEAETEDDLWDADMQPPMSGQHLAGCELRFHDLAVKFSNSNNDFDTPYVAPDGKKFYILVTAERISDAGKYVRRIKLPAVGERFMFNTSAAWLTAKLYTFWSRGSFGNGKSMDGMIQATELSEGEVLKLARLASRTVQAETVKEDVSESEPLNFDDRFPADEPPF